MSRPRQIYCKRGHLLSEAHVVQTKRGLKRTCRKCRAIRQKSYLAIALAFLLCPAMPVAAAPPEGADLNSPLAGWYKSLRVPPTGGENAGMSCCSIADCRPAKARLGAAGCEGMLEMKVALALAYASLVLSAIAAGLNTAVLLLWMFS